MNSDSATTTKIAPSWVTSQAMKAAIAANNDTH